jgi:hypothetical protein
MFDIPEVLIVLLTAVLLVLGTKHWISTIAPNRSRTNSNKGN